MDGGRYQSPKTFLWNQFSAHSIGADERIYPASGGVKHEFLQWSDSGAVIHFTKNGNEPVESDSVYTRPVVVQSTMTLKAKAFLTGWNPGSTAAAAYIITTAVEDQEMPVEITSDFVLEQNYPNPFNPSTRIRYELPEASRMSLCVYAVHGALIRTLADGEAAPGVYHAVWNGTDGDGNPVPAGIYLFKMTAGAHTCIRKMTLIK